MAKNYQSLALSLPALFAAPQRAALVIFVLQARLNKVTKAGASASCCPQHGSHQGPQEHESNLL